MVTGDPSEVLRRARHEAGLTPADDTVRLRLVFEFLRGAAEDDQPVRLLVAAEPHASVAP